MSYNFAYVPSRSDGTMVRVSEKRLCKTHSDIECLSDYDFCAYCWDNEIRERVEISESEMRALYGDR